MTRKAPTFSDLGLDEPVCRALGPGTFPAPTTLQRRVLPVLIQGRDLVAAAPDGAGKTTAYLLALLHRLSTPAVPAGAKAPRALVLAPDPERAESIGMDLEARSRFTPIRHVVAVEGGAWNHQVEELKSGADVLVATPRQVMELLRQRAVQLGSVEIAVLDAADHLLTEDSTTRLTEILNELPEARQSAIFSTTAPASLRDLAVEWLNDPIGVRLGDADVEPTPPRVDLTMAPVEPEHLRDDVPLGRAKEAPPASETDVLQPPTGHPLDLRLDGPIELPAWLEELPTPESIFESLPDWLDNDAPCFDLPDHEAQRAEREHVPPVSGLAVFDEAAATESPRRAKAAPARPNSEAPAGPPATTPRVSGLAVLDDPAADRPRAQVAARPEESEESEDLGALDEPSAPETDVPGSESTAPTAAQATPPARRTASRATAKKTAKVAKRATKKAAKKATKKTVERAGKKTAKKAAKKSTAQKQSKKTAQRKAAKKAGKKAARAASARTER